MSLILATLVLVVACVFYGVLLVIVTTIAYWRQQIRLR
jgi:ABC-type uncharacterized transport system permease subunit